MNRRAANFEAEQELEDQRRQAATDAGTAPRQPFGQRRTDNIMATETQQELDDIAFRDGVDAGVTPGPLPHAERNVMGRAEATTNEESRNLQNTGQITPEQNTTIEVTDDRRSFQPAPEPESVETATSPAPELAPEQERVMEGLQPAIQRAANSSVASDGANSSGGNRNTGTGLSDADQQEADRRNALLQDATRRVLGLSGHKGKDALRYLALVIEAIGSGWNGNPSQLVNKIWEDYKAMRDHDNDLATMTHGAQLTLEQAMQDQAFRREMAEMEQAFTRDMAEFHEMNDRERMRLADQLNREMARLERQLGDDALRTGLAIQLQNDKTFMDFVMSNPERWAAFRRFDRGVGAAERTMSLVGQGFGTAATGAAILKP